MAASAAQAQNTDCPIDSVVAKIVSIDPGGHMAMLTRGRATPQPVGVGACILYDDRLEVSPGDVATLWLAMGERHVGGAYDSVYLAPKSPAQPAKESITSFFGRLFGGFEAAKSTPATSRGGDLSCEAAGPDAPALAPLESLPPGNQRIGADNARLVVAWMPMPDPYSVRLELRDATGNIVARAETCRASHAALKLPAAPHANDRLRLDILDGRGGDLRYAIEVVAPDELPQPPVRGASDWLNGAWRLAAGGSEFALDGLTRLQSAPADALAARELSALFFDNRPLKFTP
jgi:hypothetical protein